MWAGLWRKLSPKNWCFWSVVLEKTLESPWTARRSNPPILKEISPGCSLEGMMLKLKLQYFGHLMWKLTHWKRLGGIGSRRKRGWQRMRWFNGNYRLDGCECEWTPEAGDGQGGLACCNSWGFKELEMTEQLNWAELNGLICFPTLFKSEFCYNEFMIWATVISWSYFGWLYRTSPT